MPNTDGALTNWLRRARTVQAFYVASQSKLLSVLGCLLQPGLFYLRIQKSMRGKCNPLIKSCARWTVPAAGIKSIGLLAAMQTT